MTGLKHPKKYKGRQVAPMRGRTLSGLLNGNVDKVYRANEPIGGEMGGGKWLRLGNYNAVMVPPPYGQNKWQLFDLSKDPGETTDVSTRFPDKLEELKTAWKQYANEVGVVEVGGQ